jgi:hypothetical protein
MATIKKTRNNKYWQGYGKKAKYTHFKDDYSTLEYKHGNIMKYFMKMNDGSLTYSTTNNGVKPYESIDFIDVLSSK